MTKDMDKCKTCVQSNEADPSTAKCVAVSLESFAYPKQIC